MRYFRLLLLLCAAGAISACATVPIDQARLAYERGDYTAATTLLSSDEIRKKDRILALMEQGSIWHEAGNFERSSEVLLEATELLNATDYVSLSEKATSLTINEWTKTYRGESAERLWIHTYQMMNFLLLGQGESAAVEARQAIALMEKSGSELESDYFTRALLATAFDSVRLYNDAYIEYRKLSELLPANTVASALRDDRARRSGIPAPSATTIKQSKSARANEGELILFVASGNIPRKISGNIFPYPGERISFPIYEIDQNVTPQLTVTVEGENRTIKPSSNQLIATSLGSVARKALGARGARLAASHIARSSVKNALVHATEHESASAAAVLEIVFFLLEEADTRGWATLPAHLSMVRIPLTAGKHSITVLNNLAAGPVNTQILNDVEIPPGGTIYRKVRL